MAYQYSLDQKAKSQSRSFASRWSPLEASSPSGRARHSLKLRDWSHYLSIEGLWHSYRLFSSTISRPQILRMPSSRSKTFNLRWNPVNKPQNLHSSKFGEYMTLLNLGLFNDDPPSLQFLRFPSRSLNPPPSQTRQPVFAGRSSTGLRGRMLPRNPILRLPTRQPKLAERARALKRTPSYQKVNYFQQAVIKTRRRTGSATFLACQEPGKITRNPNLKRMKTSK